MARKVLVRLVDDLDGEPGDDVSTVTFALDRVNYEIDLNATNADTLREALADYIAAARRSGGRIRRGQRSAAASRSGDAAAIREWARSEGHELGERGRIPGHIVEAFRAAERGGRGSGRVRTAAAAATKTATRATVKAGKSAPVTKKTKSGAKGGKTAGRRR